MSVSKQDNPDVLEDENFIQRWSRRKQEAEQNSALRNEPIPASEDLTEKKQLTDADMPAIDSLTEDSDYSGFFSPKVSEALRKQALGKLFHSPVFNIRDGLDDYDGVYNEFEKLGDIITADMRHQLEMEAQRREQQMTEVDPIENNEEVEVASISSASDEISTTEAGQGDFKTEQIDTVDETEVES